MQTWTPSSSSSWWARNVVSRAVVDALWTLCGRSVAPPSCLFFSRDSGRSDPFFGSAFSQQFRVTCLSGTLKPGTGTTGTTGTMSCQTFRRLSSRSWFSLPGGMAGKHRAPGCDLGRSLQWCPAKAAQQDLEHSLFEFQKKFGTLNFWDREALGTRSSYITFPYFWGQYSEVQTVWLAPSVVLQVPAHRHPSAGPISVELCWAGSVERNARRRRGPTRGFDAKVSSLIFHALHILCTKVVGSEFGERHGTPVVVLRTTDFGSDSQQAFGPSIGSGVSWRPPWPRAPRAPRARPRWRLRSVHRSRISGAIAEMKASGTRHGTTRADHFSKFRSFENSATRQVPERIGGGTARDPLPLRGRRGPLDLFQVQVTSQDMSRHVKTWVEYESNKIRKMWCFVSSVGISKNFFGFKFFNVLRLLWPVSQLTEVPDTLAEFVSDLIVLQERCLKISSCETKCLGTSKTKKIEKTWIDMNRHESTIFEPPRSITSLSFRWRRWRWKRPLSRICWIAWRSWP